MRSTYSSLVYLMMMSLFLLPARLQGGKEPTEDARIKPYDLGFLPYISFSADKGFVYGIILQWDDKRSPEYQPYYLSHRIVLEQTTGGIRDYFYRLDSKYLLPANLRLTLDVRYVTSQFEPYYGPGGAQTVFNQAHIDTSSDLFRGKRYYMYDKQYLRVNTLVQGWLKGKELRWLAGLVVLSTAIDTMDYGKETGRSLLAHHWEQLGTDTAGGMENGLVVGLVWDRRDHETSPRKGFWSEVLVRYMTGLLASDFNYLALSATHRQYIPLTESLTFAFRISGRIITDGVPFFSTPRLDGSFATEYGLGGNKSIRGVLWQRAVGRRFFYGNLELRYRVLPLFRTGYLAGNVFYDFGRTFDHQSDKDPYYDRGEANDRLHQGVGFGLRLATSDTFIIALDLGWPVEGDMDGPGLKVYMDLDWLF